MVSLAAPSSSMPPPPTPLSTRPNLGLKRDSSYLDTDDEAGLLTTTKRLRVAFDDNVDVRIMDDWNDKSFDLVKEEVQLGIELHLAPPQERDDTLFNKLVLLLNQEPTSGEAPGPKLLRKYLMALDSRIHLLGECWPLVSAVLDIPWLGRSDSFVNVYARFLITLASAHVKFVPPMMKRMASNFERISRSTENLPGEERLSRDTILQRLHTVLRLLLQRVPSAGGILARTLKSGFPKDNASTRSYLRYQKNLLQLADENPELKAEMLAIVMQRVVAVDVQIQRELDDLELDEDDKLLQDPAQRDSLDNFDESDESDDGTDSETNITLTDEELRLQDIRLKVAKMDGTQDLLFQFYSPSFVTGVSPKTNFTYRQLLSHFDNYIMPARTRHAQFLIFHFAQTSPGYAQDFAQHCMNILNDRNTQLTSRLTACAYVASFIARGSHVTTELVQEVFSKLCYYLEMIRGTWEPACTGPDKRSFGLYYAVTQALLYIFCFRWRDLVSGVSISASETSGLDEEDILAEGRDLIWLPGIKETLTRNVHSVFNPLKVCSAPIVGEFARIANHLRFMYVFSLPERNKRVRLGQTHAMYHVVGAIDLGRRETAYDRKKGEEHHQLEAYFPFDPYQLPRSKKWLIGEYNAWKLPRGLKDDDDEDEEEVEDESDYESEYESDEGGFPDVVASDVLPVSS